MVGYVNTAGAAVAELVTGDDPDDAPEADNSGQRLPELGTVDVQRISVGNRNLLDGPEEHRGRVVGVGQIGGCGRLAVPLSIVGDDLLAALASRLVRVAAEAQLWTWKVDALRLGNGQKLGDQQGCPANQCYVLKSRDLADLPDDGGPFFLEEWEEEAVPDCQPQFG